MIDRLMNPEFQASLSGRAEGLAWRYFWLAPVDVQKSRALNSTTKPLGGRLALFYVNAHKGDSPR